MIVLELGVQETFIMVPVTLKLKSEIKTSFAYLKINYIKFKIVLV